MIGLLTAGVALLSVLLGAVGWALYGLLRQNGRLLSRLEALEAARDESQTAPARAAADRSLARSKINRSGLTPGTIAPAFRLAALDGGETALADYAGRSLLLVFSDPDCAPCQTLLPRLQRAAAASETAVLVISRGTVEANRQKMKAAGVTLAVALQAHWEISRLYAQFNTPAGYLVDQNGRIASPVALGAGPILALLSNTNQQRRQPEGASGTPRVSVH